MFFLCLPLKEFLNEACSREALQSMVGSLGDTGAICLRNNLVTFPARSLRDMSYCDIPRYRLLQRSCITYTAKERYIETLYHTAEFIALWTSNINCECNEQVEAVVRYFTTKNVVNSPSTKVNGRIIKTRPVCTSVFNRCEGSDVIF